MIDVAGRTVRTLASGAFGAGRNAVPWDGRDARGVPAPGGLYFVRLISHDGVRLARVLRLR